MFPAALLVALCFVGDETDWSPLSFRGIPEIRHQVMGDERIRLLVDESAGGLVRALPAGTQVGKLEVRGRVQGEIISDEGRLWERSTDDAYLRIGLIHDGGKPLNALQRAVAPGWIRQIDKVVCVDGRGPARIQNLILAPHESWVGKSRAHPKMQQLQERVIAVPAENGTFKMVVEFDQPIDLLGLWLMADGDDTASQFIVTVTSILIKP